MGIIICQFCGQVIEYIEHEKVSKMYAACHECDATENTVAEED